MTKRREGPIRVALAGAGMISWHHLTAWRKLGERIRLVAVCEPDPERGKARAAEFGIGRVCRTPEELFYGEAIDALDIASPRETHVGWIDAAAAHGADIICQKPLAPTLAEAEAALGRVGGRVRVMAHENWRFRPWYRDVAAIIRAGELGEVAQATMRMHSAEIVPDATGRIPGLERQPFMARERKLMIAEVLIHHLDVVRFLCGPLRVIAARTQHTVAEVAGETAATILLETGSGCPVVVTGTMAAPGFPHRTKDRLEIVGSKASIVLDAEEFRVLGPSSRTLRYDFDQAYQASFDNAIRHFVECLEDGAPFETDAADNLETLRLVEDAYAAAGAAQPPTKAGRIP
jgi:D-apiose dehydrogenase